MNSKIIIAILLIIIGIQSYNKVEARSVQLNDTVGDIDCVLYDVEFSGWKINELRAIGYLTEIDD